MTAESAAYDEPGDWIVEQAGQKGVTISRRQLAEWHRAGLISKPKQERLGQGKGSRSVYPRGTLRQAIMCSQVMARVGSTRGVGWELWMRGFPVLESYWRDPFRDAYNAIRGLYERSVEPGDRGDDGSPVQSDAIEELISEISERPVLPTGVSLVRRRLGRQGLKELLGIVISTLIGAFKLSEGGANESADPAHVMARLVGTLPAKHKARVPSSPFLALTGQSVAENLEAMAEKLPRIVSSLSPQEISEAQLTAARDEVAFLINLFLSLRENEGRIIPGSTPDVKLVRQIFSHSSTIQPVVILLWLAVRNIPGWRENLDTIRKGVMAVLEKAK